MSYASHFHVESLLNAGWLLLSLAVLLICAWAKCALNEPKFDWTRTLVAAFMVALFLFPIVSATDDLHFTQAVVEEPAAKKIVAMNQETSATATTHPALFLVLLGALFLRPQARVTGRIVEQKSVGSLQSFLHLLAGRAPPVAY